MNLDKKGSAIPLYVGIVLIAMTLFFGALYFFVGKSVNVTVDTFENAAPSNTPRGIYDSLHTIWMALPIVGLIAVVIWAFAKTHQEDVGGVRGVYE